MTKKGQEIVRLPARKIAERRDHIRRLDLLGASVQTILSTLREEAPGLIDRQAAPDKLIREELQIVRKEALEELTGMGFAAPGAGGIADYIATKRLLLSQAVALADNANIRDSARARFLAIANTVADDIARTRGVKVDQPTFNLNVLLQQQLLALGIAPEMVESLMAPVGVPLLPAATAGAWPGIVDALTFAISPEFCNLPSILRDYPMQEQVLREFMGPSSRYRTLILVCGMRSGKGVVGSIVAWYAAYTLLSLADPQHYFGLTPNQEISIVTMATSRDQARRNVFKHIEDRLETGGAWFQALRPQANIAGLEIHLPKNIVIRCGHSKASTQVGGTNYLVILDELARMKDTEGRDNADEVYDKMNATTATFQDEGKLLVLTSPEWEGDKAMRLLEEAVEVDGDGRAVRPQMMGLQMATWEANRTFAEEWLWEAFDGEANPQAFWRDFGARPPLAVEGYYPDPERWDRQADPDLRDPYDEADQLADWWEPCCDAKRFVHVDLGVKRDACGLAMAHKPVLGCPYFQARDGEPNPRTKAVVVDIAYRIVPKRQREAKGEVSFEKVRQMIRDWSDRSFNVKGGGVSYDGWQSIDSRQILKKEGFRVREYSLDRDTEGHDTLQELVNTDRLAYPAYPMLIQEAKRLTLVRGKKVDHPKGGSKDVVDAVAGAVYHALKRGGRQAFVG